MAVCCYLVPVVRGPSRFIEAAAAGRHSCRQHVEGNGDLNSGRNQGGGVAPSLHRLWEKFRFSAVLQAIRKGTGNYALPSKYISEYNICFVQVSLVYQFIIFITLIHLGF